MQKIAHFYILLEVCKLLPYKVMQIRTLGPTVAPSLWPTRQEFVFCSWGHELCRLHINNMDGAQRDASWHRQLLVLHLLNVFVFAVNIFQLIRRRRKIICCSLNPIHSPKPRKKKEFVVSSQRMPTRKTYRAGRQRSRVRNGWNSRKFQLALLDITSYVTFSFITHFLFIMFDKSSHLFIPRHISYIFDRILFRSLFLSIRNFDQQFRPTLQECFRLINIVACL